MKIKLFYSYSHIDEIYRNKLEAHLAILRDDGLIDEWYDRKIKPGDDWNQEIEKNIETAHIILLLLSQDFINSESCKKEVDTAMKLKKEQNIILLPIILKVCSWKDINNLSKIQALPKDGRPIKKWSDQDEAWQDVYQGIKINVKDIRKNIIPRLKNEFKNELLHNPIVGYTLDKLFVYPDILEVAKSNQKLENNEIDSVKLKDIKNFKHKYILIEGEEQSGKTSLSNMLYLHYIDTEFYPVLISGKDISGKADIENIINKNFIKQYDCSEKYFSLDKEKIILIVDDIDESSANDDNYAKFLQAINSYFEYAIIFIDKLSNLLDKTTKHDCFYNCHDYTIKYLGHKKRDEIIKKCIANDENMDFDINNTDQLARLDKDTQYINNIIGPNFIPSYPFFIISIFNVAEALIQQDMSQTSYGHCYHTIITLQLSRLDIRPDRMNEYFNFLTYFSYFIFNEGKNNIPNDKLAVFKKEYSNNYIVDEKIIDKLIMANILINKNNLYSFQYIYIYYYFVAKYISENINDKKVKNQFENLISTIHKKDSSNIIIFITHHTKSNLLLDEILINSMSNFEKFTEATLEKYETKFIDDEIKKLAEITFPSEGHNIDKTRSLRLKEKDNLQPIIDKKENEIENDENNLLLVEIRKSAKNIEIIGQIMKNQYGTFKKNKLYELFEEGQNVGLRLLKSFIDLMNHNTDELNYFFQKRLLKMAKEKNKNISKENAMLISKQLVTRFSYSIIFGWLYKISSSLGYDKLIGIANEVNDKTNSIASNLINLSIHTWYKKELDIEKLKFLYKKFDKDKNYVAIHILKDIVARHIYMHKVDYKKKQQIDSLLKFSVQKQITAQEKLKISH